MTSNERLVRAQQAELGVGTDTHPCPLAGVQLADGRRTHTKAMGRGYANPSFVHSFLDVRQTSFKPGKVKSMPSFKDNVSNGKMNPSSQSSPSSRSHLRPISISGQCAFQYSSWNNLRFVDELDSKRAEEVRDNVESRERTNLEIQVGTSMDSEVIEMDVTCNT